MDERPLHRLAVTAWRCLSTAWRRGSDFGCDGGASVGGVDCLLVNFVSSCVFKIEMADGRERLTKMGKPRTKRKNMQKRKARRVFATIAAELQATEAAQTPEALERERLEHEAERQRVHEQWSRAVAVSTAAFEKKKRVKEERLRLLKAIRQRMENEPKD